MEIRFTLTRPMLPGRYVLSANFGSGSIKNVIFNDPATIVFWSDGTKTVVKCHGEDFDPEKGLAMAISKKIFGNNGGYYNIFKKFLPEKEAETKGLIQNICTEQKHYTLYEYLASYFERKKNENSEDKEEPDT